MIINLYLLIRNNCTKYFAIAIYIRYIHIPSTSLKEQKKNSTEIWTCLPNCLNSLLLLQGLLWWPTSGFRVCGTGIHREAVLTRQERVGHHCPLHRQCGLLHGQAPHPTPGAPREKHDHGTETCPATEDSQPGRPHG